MKKGIKIRLYPNDSQIIILNKIFGHTRFVYNYFLNYSLETNDYNYNNWSSKLTELKRNPETYFLKEADKFSLQNSLRNLKKAYENYFSKRCKKPNYKSKKNKQSYTTNYTNNNIEILSNKIKLPKLGYVKCKYNKDLTNIKIVNITIIRNKCGVYEASLIYECDDLILSKTGKDVGIDLGVRKLITTSDNETYLCDMDLDKISNKTRRKQRELSRCIKESKRYEKRRKELAKIYRYKENYINDQIHKATKAIVVNYDNIYMEDLDINQLLSIQKIKKQKQKMISYSLGKIKIFLNYKCKMYDKKLVLIDRYYASSHICSVCGNRYEVKASEIYNCPICKNKMDRDLNAAINILNYGLAHN